MIAVNQVCEAQTDQPNTHSSGVNFIEKFQRHSGQRVVGRRVSNFVLLGFRIEIGISDFDNNRGSQPFFLP